MVYSSSHYERNKEQYRANQRRYTQEHPHKAWAASTLHDHRIKGMITEISTKELEDIAIHVRYCEYCDKELIYRNKGGQCEASASLDRIDNENIIRADNIKIVCNECNSTKRTRSFEDFVLYCKKIVDKFYMEVEE